MYQLRYYTFKCFSDVFWKFFERVRNQQAMAGRGKLLKLLLSVF